MEKLFNRFRKENSLTDGEKDLLNQKVYGQINFEEKGSNFFNKFLKLTFIVSLGLLVPIAVFILKPDSRITETVTKKVSAQAILEEAVEELERILSNANYVRYKLLVERQNSPLEGQIYTKDDILVEIDIEDERYNFYDSKSSDFEEFVESDGTVQTFFGQGYSRLVRGNREYYGYLTGDSNSGDISLERVVNESQIEGYYEFPEAILPQMQVNHVEFYIEVIDFIKKEVKPDEISEEVLNISGIDYEVYKIPFEYKYTSFDTDQQLIEDLFRATIYVDKNTKLPVRIEDERDLTLGAVEIVTTDLVEVEYELYSDTELAEIFALDFDPDKIKPYDPYILDIEEVKFEGMISSGNSGEVFNTPKFSTNGKTYKIKSQKYYDPFINLPTILGKFLQGREVIVNGYVSGDNFIPIEFELVRRSGK